MIVGFLVIIDGCVSNSPVSTYLCVAQVRKSSLSQVLNAEAYMLFYKKGVALAKLMQEDGATVRQLSANS